MSELKVSNVPHFELQGKIEIANFFASLEAVYSQTVESIKPTQLDYQVIAILRRGAFILLCLLVLIGLSLRLQPGITISLLCLTAGFVFVKIYAISLQTKTMIIPSKLTVLLILLSITLAILSFVSLWF